MSNLGQSVVIQDFCGLFGYRCALFPRMGLSLQEKAGSKNEFQSLVLAYNPEKGKERNV